jgi:hypothetical protein
MSGFRTNRGQFSDKPKFTRLLNQPLDPIVKLNTTQTLEHDLRAKPHHFAQNGAVQDAVLTKQAQKFGCADDED